MTQLFRAPRSAQVSEGRVFTFGMNQAPLPFFLASRSRSRWLLFRAPETPGHQGEEAPVSRLCSSRCLFSRR